MWLSGELFYTSDLVIDCPADRDLLEASIFSITWDLTGLSHLHKNHPFDLIPAFTPPAPRFTFVSLWKKAVVYSLVTSHLASYATIICCCGVDVPNVSLPADVARPIFLAPPERVYLVFPTFPNIPAQAWG